MAESGNGEAGRLEDIAGAVADRTPVDWELEAKRTPERSSELARLREIAELQAVHARLRDPDPDIESAGLFAWGPLEVIEKIGEGSFAEVFVAHDPALRREVALKLRRTDTDRLAPGAARWLEEARRLARVRHPNVLLVHGVDEHDGRAGLWTERVRGVTLEDWIAAHGALGPREAGGIVLDLCGALAAVHAAGLVHGDVTTRNVMREGGAGTPAGTGRIVLMDFGSAHEARATDLVAFGTPLFTAPEVLDGGPPTVAADVYSLGVVFFRLLSARWPVEGDSLAQIRERLAHGERLAIRDLRPELSAGLVAVVERALAPDPAQRYASPAELERALSSALAAGAPAARPARRGVVYVWAAAAALLVALAVVLLRGGGRLPGARPVVGGDVASGAISADGAAALQPPPTASPAAGAATPVVPEVEARLVRIDADVRAPLRSGDQVAPGDRLALEIESPAKLHVYVLNEDEHGAVFVLFPLRGRGTGNPLAGGTSHRLPGGERDPELAWQVTSAGGKERFLILASAERLPPVADAIAAIPDAGADANVAYPVLSAAALAKLRGTGGVVRTPPLPADLHPSMLAALARDLARSPSWRAIWMRTIVLENPVP